MGRCIPEAQFCKNLYEGSISLFDVIREFITKIRNQLFYKFFYCRNRISKILTPQEHWFQYQQIISRISHIKQDYFKFHLKIKHKESYQIKITFG
mgnify:CR=1 FL=1